MNEPAKPSPVGAANNPQPNATASVRRWRAWIVPGYLATAAMSFLVLLVLASLFDYFPLDLQITHGLQQAGASQPFFAFMWAVSYPGFFPQSYVIAGAIILLFHLFGRRWEAAAALIPILGSDLVVALVKNLVQRPRPASDLVLVFQQLDTYSFPSGHVVFYTAFYGFLLFLAFSLLKPSYGRGLLVVILTGLIILVGPSRIYLGHHWASDVAGGYLLGSLWLALTIYIYQWGRSRFFKPVTN